MIEEALWVVAFFAGAIALGGVVVVIAHWLREAGRVLAVADELAARRVAIGRALVARGLSANEVAAQSTLEREDARSALMLVQLVSFGDRKLSALAVEELIDTGDVVIPVVEAALEGAHPDMAVDLRKVLWALEAEHRPDGGDPLVEVFR